jgi:single-stranded DNA-binding protein
MNTITIQGKVTKAGLETAFVDGGNTRRVSFSVADFRNVAPKGADKPEFKTNFWNVTVYGELADLADSNLKGESFVKVIGRAEQYKGKNDDEKAPSRISVRGYELYSRIGEGEDASYVPLTDSSEDDPFAGM